jgi:hypothetical protein
MLKRALVQSNNKKSGAKVQRQPTLCNPNNNNSNNLNVITGASPNF